MTIGLDDRIEGHLNWDKLLYVITDPHIVERSLTDAVEQAVRGGAGAIQLRDKQATREDLITTGKALHQKTQKYGVPLFINDDIEAALAVNAEGVHLGQGDLSFAEARARANGAGRPDLIIGISATTFEEALQADTEGADYIGVGPIYPTNSKDDASTPLGLAELARIVTHVRAYVIAIGGISGTNIEDVMQTGCQGAAVISAVMGASDPGAAAKDLLVKMRG